MTVKNHTFNYEVTEEDHEHAMATQSSDKRIKSHIDRGHFGYTKPGSHPKRSTLYDRK